MSSPPTTVTDVDLTTIYGTIMALTEPLPGDWAKCSMSDFGSLALLHPDIRVPAPPSDRTDAGALLKQFLGKVATRAGFTQPQIDEASLAVKNLLNQPDVIGKIQSELNRLVYDPESNKWLGWHERNEWETRHANRKVEFIDTMFLNQVENIANIPSSNLASFNDQARINPSGFVMNVDESQERAYIANVLVRGLFYDELGRLDGRQIVHHSVRRGLFQQQELTASHEIEISIPPAIPYLLHILREEARTVGAGDSTQIAAKWASDIVMCRKYIAKNPLTNDPGFKEDAAKAEAVNVACEAHVCSTLKAHKRLDVALDILAGVVWCGVISWKPYYASVIPVLQRRLKDTAHQLLRTEERWIRTRLTDRGPGRVHTCIRARSFEACG